MGPIRHVLLQVAGIVSVMNGCMTSAIQGVSLIKAFHHHAPTFHKVILYVDKPCTIERRGDGVFYLPGVTVNTSEAQQMVNSINDGMNNHAIRLTASSEGLTVKATHHAVGWSNAQAYQCSSIGGKPAFVFMVTKQPAPIAPETKNTQKKPLVIIDCGHGGDDSGAISATGILEKNVVLAVGRFVTEGLERRGIKTQMIRTQDVFVPLNTRTARANQTQDSILVSIHANANPRTQVQGIETYYGDHELLTPINDQENAAISAFRVRDERSKQLATAVHEALVRLVGQQGYPVFDRRVRKSSSQILLGTAMPSILVELGFLSNSSEADRLAQEQYQRTLAQGIVAGIAAYCNG